MPRESFNTEGDDGETGGPTASELYSAAMSSLGGSRRTPSTEGEGLPDDGGVVRRANQFVSRINASQMELMAVRGEELRNAIRTRAGELYRNRFPHLRPAFGKKCEECGLEHEGEPGECDSCGSGDLRDPSVAQRREAEDFFRRVNREGQSLRGLYEFLAEDGGRLGVWVHLVRHRYGVIDGEVIEEPFELVRADPKRVKPVVDADGRIGGHWWACPIHREIRDREGMLEVDGECPECGADLREVFYAEVEMPGDTDEADVEDVYFENEVVTHADFNRRAHGLDGLSPVASNWLSQSVLWWMKVYAAGFYDQQHGDRYPGKIAFLHTTNKEAVEKQLEEQKDRAREDPYAEGFVYNEVPERGGETNSAQVVDMLGDKFLGQSEQIREALKKDVRRAYGVSDAQDNDLSDAGGLNNEGLQLEISDRDRASTQQRLSEGPLRKLMRVLGFDEWELGFVPENTRGMEMDQKQVADAVSTAEQSGVAYEVTDGQFRVADTDGVVEPEPEGEEGGGGMMPEPDVAPPGEPLEQSLRWLEDAHRDVVWADGLSTEAEPEWEDSDDMPEFVANLVEQAIPEADFVAPEGVDGGEWDEFLGDQLTQRQGWSLESIVGNAAERFGLDVGELEQPVRTSVAETLNTAREIGYEREGDDATGRAFKWIGPRDGRTTDACRYIKELTNPDVGAGEMVARHGVPAYLEEAGRPVRLDTLKRLVKDVSSEFFPDYDTDGTTAHWHERHTFVEDHDMEPQA